MTKIISIRFFLLIISFVSFSFALPVQAAGTLTTNSCNPTVYMEYGSTNISSGSQCSIVATSNGGPSVDPRNPPINSFNNTTQFTIPANNTGTTQNYTYTMTCGFNPPDTATFAVPACAPTSCTGTIPANASAYSGDSDGNTAWTYSSTNTAAKCQFSCSSGTWNGSSCVVGDPGALGVTISASPNPIPYNGSGFAGGETNVTWAVTGSATSCTASQDPASGIVVWNGSKNSTTGTHNQTISLLSNTRLYISCQGPSGTVQDDVFVTVVPPPPVTSGPRLLVCPSSANITSGTTVDLHSYYWSNALDVSCADLSGSSDVTNPSAWSTANSGIATVNNSGGNAVVTGQTNGDVNITAQHLGLSAISRITVGTGRRMVICPADSTIAVGNTVQLQALYWVNAGAVDCSTPGGQNVTIDYATSWTSANTSVATVNNTSNKGRVTGVSAGSVGIQVLSYAGVTASANVNVTGTAPVVTLTANPTSITSGNSSTLTWTVSNATTCTASSIPASSSWSGAKSTTGDAQSVSPTAYTVYDISCTGPGGTASASASVIVNPSGSTGPRLIICPATPPSIAVGASTNLEAYYWADAGTVTCESKSPTIVTSNSGTSWSRTPISIATVSNTGTKGIVTGSAPGTVNVKVAYSSLEANKNITVTGGGGGDPNPPTIGIVVDPKIVRSGEKADVDVEIQSDTDVTCELFGAVTTPPFTHTGSPAATPYEFETVSLTSARIVRVICGATKKDARIDVIPTFQEI